MIKRNSLWGHTGYGNLVFLPELHSIYLGIEFDMLS
ncbi:hypothetical protein QF042_002118 [Pedobacter sp. W3I1]|nr:hypothetical protein [Pedobacter sp. W3I1]